MNSRWHLSEGNAIIKVLIVQSFCYTVYDYISRFPFLEFHIFQKIYIIIFHELKKKKEFRFNPDFRMGYYYILQNFEN